VNRSQAGGYSVSLIALISGHGELINKSSDSSEGSPVDLFLRFANCLELALRYAQGMIAALDDVQKIPRFHFGSHPL
jgi:hypothetical protein